jgi:hypothetical protein
MASDPCYDAVVSLAGVHLARAWDCDGSYANLAETVVNYLKAVGIRAQLRPLERLKGGHDAPCGACVEQLPKAETLGDGFKTEGRAVVWPTRWSGDERRRRRKVHAQRDHDRDRADGGVACRGEMRPCLRQDAPRSR